MRQLARIRCSKQIPGLGSVNVPSNPTNKDHDYFLTMEEARGLLETIFLQISMKPLLLGNFGEMSSHVVEFVETAVEYGMEHLWRNMAAANVEALQDLVVHSGVEGLFQPTP